MNKLPPEKKRRLLAILLAALILLAIVLSRAGIYLQRSDSLQQADAIVVLMGSSGDRALHAFELLEAGWARQIILSGTHTSARELFAQRNIHIPNNADIVRQLLNELGVANTLITTIAGSVQSTTEEAQLLRSFLETIEPLDTLLLVTSSYHTRRVGITYRHVLNKLDAPPVLITSASPYTEFQARRWWRCRQSAKHVVMEYSRLFYFWMWERWRQR